jgi:hypothetical protein
MRRGRNRRAVTVAAILVTVLAASACTRRGQVGSVAPPISGGPWVNGDAPDLDGRSVVLVFFSPT